MLGLVLVVVMLLSIFLLLKFKFLSNVSLYYYLILKMVFILPIMTLGFMGVFSFDFVMSYFIVVDLLLVVYVFSL